METRELQLFVKTLRKKAEHLRESDPTAYGVLTAIAESLDVLMTARQLAEIMGESE